MSAPTTNPTRLRLALLSNGVSPHNDNHARICAALGADDWELHVFAHEDVRILEGVVCGQEQPLLDYDLVWMLGLGEQQDFMDRCQILANLPPDKMLNSALAMLAMHSKHIALPHSPLTCSGNRPEDLLRYVDQHPEVERWIVKPAAGSYGRGVSRANSRDELKRLLQHSTVGRKYCVLQAFVEQITAGETRSLVVGGEIIGSYIRVPDRDFRANLTQGAQARPTKLNTQQIQQVKEVAAALADRGVRFAAIDMAFPYLIEVNIANPGGLATLATLEAGSQPNVGRRLAAALRRLAETSH